MTVTASLKLTQNAVTNGPGVSLIGVGGLAVTLENGNNLNVIRWIFELLDTPIGSALSPGILSDGPTNNTSFTPDSSPDTPGCYRIKLTVIGSDGSTDCDIRNFAVPTPVSGWILPPFRATADEMNFPTNTEGWETYLNQAFLDLDSVLATLEDFGASDATFPTPNGSSPAESTTRNVHPILAYDDTTNEVAFFEGYIPSHYKSGDVVVRLDWAAATATTGDVKWNAAFERLNVGGPDLDVDDFAADQTTTSTTAGAAGVLTRTTITFTNAQADSIGAGEAFRLRVTRDAADGADDLVGDAHLFKVSLIQ
jgi:hypothetical protein